MDFSRILTNTEPRIYQQVIFSECVTNVGNTLVVLPTGLGKTIIMAYLAAYHLKKEPIKQILILTPTRPLVHQIKEMMAHFIGNLSPDKILEISGEISPQEREKNYPNARIIVATPQTIENDITYDRIDLKKFVLLCIDEVHRATGDYAYVGIASQVKCQIIGFTATPGNNPEKILEVCENLRISKISVTDASDLDVRDYISIHTPKVVWIELPEEYKLVLQHLENFQNELVDILKNRMSTSFDLKYLGKREALGIHQQAVQLTKQDPSFGDLLLYSANLIRVQHLKELVESQGFTQAYQSLKKWRKKSLSKALRLFLEDSRIISLEKKLSEGQKIHPKLKHLIDEINSILQTAKSQDSKIIIFSNFRDTVRFLHTELSKVGISTDIFIGHSSSRDDKGLTQKQQLSVVEEFKRGSLQILLSTSVGEEGLDVGNCDLVVFYDSVPSVVRSIQRRGRGRKKQSRVIHLVTKGTRDEAMYWAIKRKDKQMKTFLKKELPTILKQKKIEERQETLDSYFSKKKDGNNFKSDESGPRIIIDTRETTSRIPKLLKQQGAQLVSKTLEIGDYVLSNRLIVEFKTYSDFVNSIIDGRLFRSKGSGEESQLIKLSRIGFPILIIQFESEELTQQIHINSIMGALSSIILDFRIPVIFTRNELETTSFLVQLARREQKSTSGEIILPTISRKEQNIEEIQLFMLSSIPGINITKAKNLLAKFKTLQAISVADMDSLIEVPQIGRKLAQRIISVFTFPSNSDLP